MSRHRTNESAEKLDKENRRCCDEMKLESLVTMATGVAHDFNNYLTAILGNNEIILDNLPRDSRLRLNAEQIEATSRMALALTNEILLYTARARRNPTLVDTAVVVAEVRDELRLIPGENVSVDCSIEPTCPVKADIAQIRRVVHNLASNASDALVDIPEGRIVLATGTRTCTRNQLRATFLGTGLLPGRYAFVEIRDNGKGMSADVRKRMYDPFFSTKLRGRGMGLPVVVGILRAHGGTISARTERFGETRVRVLLPCADEA